MVYKCFVFAGTVSVGYILPPPQYTTHEIVAVFADLDGDLVWGALMICSVYP